jgi:predicted NAD-dependent protein-ADP-ribosyltransferase YbiA (DUF1768 family)
MKPIICFIGQYRHYSNFHLCPVLFEELLFPSNENAFQAAKTKDLKARLPFLAYTPAKAKKFGRILNLRPDWDTVQPSGKTTAEEVMFQLTFLKWSYPTMLPLIKSNADVELIEGNWWHDNRWGDCMFASREDAFAALAGKPFQACEKCKDVQGQNKLGKTIMEVRAILLHV